VHAVMILASNADPVKAASAIRSCNARLAPHQQITGWTIWPEPQLPRTSTRKIRRNEIVHWLETHSRGKSESNLEEPRANSSPLIRVLAGALHKEPSELGLEREFTSDLGMDSLARVELAVAIEQQLGSFVSDEAVSQARTVADLERLVFAGNDSHGASAHAASWPFGRLANGARSIAQRSVLFPFLRSICRPLVIEGQEHTQDIQGPKMFVANHASHLDAALVLLALPRDVRRLTAVAAAKDYFFTSVQRALPAQIFLGAFPLARTGAIHSSLEYCGRLVDRGKSLLIFPEGTRSVNGNVAEFKAGVGLLARELRVPVVPIGIRGAREILPKGRTFPTAGPVGIQFAAPLTRSAAESDQEFANLLRDCVRSLVRTTGATANLES
jgi:long-chain acyl-CoA synthetase